VVNQPPSPLVFNAADNALDTFNVNKVQGPSLQVKRNGWCSMSIGEISINAPNNRETKTFGLLCLKFIAFGNGNDDDVLELPVKRL